MPDALTRLVGVAAPWLLTYLLHSSVLVAAVWLLTRTGWVRRARTHDLLWKTALVLGFVTSTLVLARGAWSGREPRLERVDARVVILRTGDGADGPRDLLWTPGETLPAAFQGLTSSRPMPWARTLAWVWMLGALGTLALGARRWGGSARILATAVPAGEEAQTALAGLTDGARERVVAPVVVSPAVSSPCAVGRSVVLSPRCEAELEPPELAAAMAHELAHIRRRDGLWATLGDVVCRLAWVQPLNRIAVKRMLEAAEAVCDEAALRHARPLDLARSIHKVAMWTLGERRPLPVSSLARGGGDTLSARVRRILDRRAATGSERGWRGGVVVAALAASAFLLPPVRVASELHAVFISGVTQAHVQVSGRTAEKVVKVRLVRFNDAP